MRGSRHPAIIEALHCPTARQRGRRVPSSVRRARVTRREADGTGIVVTLRGMRAAFAVAQLCLAPGCLIDDWRVPPDACARCHAPADAAAPDAGGLKTCAGQPVRALAVSLSRFACVVRCDGSVWCWGANDYGQLGDGTTTTRVTPQPVRGLGGTASAVAAGYSHACAVVRGEVRCWGYNQYGALGDGTREDRTTPVSVRGLDGPARAIAGGGRHTCATLEGGAVRCWGSNEYGALGDGSNVDRTTPRTAVALGGPVDALPLGQFSSCARLSTGAVRCWGFNGFGVLGDGTLNSRDTPLPVALPEPARSLSLLANHACAALDSGAVWCWGYNIDGALGDRSTATRPRPVVVRGLDVGAAAVAVGGRHTCAVTDDGRVRCWGGNERGQLGDGSAERRLAPVSVVDLDGAVAILGAAEASTCAALNDGRVRCWGANEDGQLGDGTTLDALAPVTVRLPP